jgi:hypothetical protein
MLGTAIGTPDALALADRLAMWHDAMVAHQRRGTGTRHCGPDCPHADAEDLCQEPVATFGARADALGFLRTQGRGRRTRRAAGEAAFA